MSAYLVDTDWFIEVLHGNAAAASVLEEHVVGGLAISLISYGELYQGAWYARDAADRLRELRDVLASFDVLPLTRSIMERFAVVRGDLTRNQRQQVGNMDLLIAATALEHELTLLTYNVRDFRLITDLQLYQP